MEENPICNELKTLEVLVMGKVTKSKKPDDNSNIGDRIRYIRTKQGISQDELGGRIFKSRGEINYY